MDVSEVADLIGISPATTRRFFNQIEKEGIAIRRHGGIQLLPDVSKSYSYSNSTTRQIEEKTLIASYAVNLVFSGDLLFLDSGTTVLKMAEALEIRIKEKELKDLVIITNSLVNYELLAPYCKVILLGGEVRMEQRDTCGYMAENALGSLHFHKSFFGTNAVHPEKGLMATDERTCRINQIASKNSDSVFVLADSSKFGAISLMTYSELDSVDKIITDEKISDEILAVFENNGANIEVARNDK